MFLKINPEWLNIFVLKQIFQSYSGIGLLTSFPIPPEISSLPQIFYPLHATATHWAYSCIVDPVFRSDNQQTCVLSGTKSVKQKIQFSINCAYIKIWKSGQTNALVTILLTCIQSSGLHCHGTQWLRKSLAFVLGVPDARVFWKQLQYEPRLQETPAKVGITNSSKKTVSKRRKFFWIKTNASINKLWEYVKITNTKVKQLLFFLPQSVFRE